MKPSNILLECKDANLRRYLKKLFKYLDKNEVKLYLIDSLTRIGNHNCGYFIESDNDGNRAIYCLVNLNNLDWVGTLIHESIHAKQMINNDPLWIKFQDLIDDVEEMIKNNSTANYPRKTRDIVIDLEWQTEKETIETIINNKLPIDIKTYSKSSNLMLYKYLLLFSKIKTWPQLTVKSHNLIMKNIPDYLLEREQFFLQKMPPLLRSQLEELRINS